jgi:hypothetical protein
MLHFVVPTDGKQKWGFLMGKQRGRRVPPPMTPKQKQAMVELNERVERTVRDLTHAQPRGFIFWVNYDDGLTEPAVSFRRLSDPVMKEMLAHTPDLVEYVQRYDPHHAFVLFEGTVNFATNQLDQVEISEQPYFFPAPPDWSPNVASLETSGQGLSTLGNETLVLDRVLERNIYLLAEQAVAEHADPRGVLFVELDEATEHGIRAVSFHTAAELRQLSRSMAFEAQAAPLASYLKTYDPAREYVVLLMDVSKHLPGPKILWKTLPITKMA